MKMKTSTTIVDDQTSTPLSTAGIYLDSTTALHVTQTDDVSLAVTNTHEFIVASKSNPIYSSTVERTINVTKKRNSVANLQSVNQTKASKVTTTTKKNINIITTRSKHSTKSLGKKHVKSTEPVRKTRHKQQKKNSSKTLVIILVVLVFLLMIGGTMSYFIHHRRKSANNEENLSDKDESNESRGSASEGSEIDQINDTAIERSQSKVPKMKKKERRNIRMFSNLDADDV